MYKNALRPAWAEIDLDALRFNIRNIQAKVGNRQVIGVVKADAYGHGAIRVAKALQDCGVHTFAIATLQEAIELREAGIEDDIIMLGLTPDMYADVVVDYNITPVVNSSENAKALGAAAVAKGKTVSGLVAIDTGMGRIGYLTEDPHAITDIKQISQVKGFTIKGMFSHFATADAADKTFAKIQEERYAAFADKLKTAGLEMPFKTFANSASIMEIPSVYYDAVRPGIILYGCYPSHEVDKSQLAIRPVMSIKAAIVKLKTVPVGYSCGYGRKFIAERESLIATLTLGYADGYPRPYSSVGKVLVKGKLAPLAGNICMDQVMVDVTDVPGVKEGDEVILMGSDGTNTILADDIADATGTINYEITCAFGQRLPKVYINE